MMRNPFREKIVTDPWHPSQTDIRPINGEAFRLCLEALRVVKKEHRTTSVLLYGEAGSGKTHLLARLQTSLQKPFIPHIFVSVRLQSNPNRLWRHIRKCLINSLLHPLQNGRLQIENLFLYRVRAFLPAKHTKVTEKELHQAIEQLQSEANLSWKICKVLEHFVLKRHRRELIAWLKGESLPATVLQPLELAQDDDMLTAPEDQARELIYELCRLAGTTFPMVFCFDQIEALQRYAGDTNGIFAFGQAIRSLYDETGNSLLISCVQSFFLEHLKEVIMAPNYAALTVHQGTLNPLNREQALKLISARLNGVSAHAAQPRSQLESSLAHDLQEFVGHQGRTAREILAYCADRFDDWKRGQRTEINAPTLVNKQSEGTETSRPEPVKQEPLPQKFPVADFLSEQVSMREEYTIRNFTPEETDEIIQGAVPVIFNILDQRWKERDQKVPKDMDMVLEGPDVKIGVSLCNYKDMNKLAGRFKRLRQQLQESDLDQLVIIRHARLPISKGAKKTREYLKSLKTQGVKLLNPTTEVIAVLEALRSLLSDAKAGDLTHAGQSIKEQTVREWLQEHIYEPPLNFLNDLMTPQATFTHDNFDLLQDVLELIEQQRVLALADVAEQLGVEMETLRTVSLRSPEKIGYLEGPPAVIFQFIPTV